MRMRKIIIIIFFCFSLVSSFAQQYSYRQYTIFDGLPQNQVVSICFDNYGFLWVGTKGGISRFDGKRFKIYYSDNPNDLHIEEIFSYRGNLYYHTKTNLYKLEGDVFKTIYAVEDNEISTVLPLKGIEKGFYIVKSNEILKYTKNSIDGIYTLWYEGFIIDAEIMKNGNILISTREGIFLYNGVTNLLVASGTGGDIDNHGNDYYFMVQTIKGKNNDCKIFKYGKDRNTILFETNTEYVASEFSFAHSDELCLIKNSVTWAIINHTGEIIEEDSILSTQISTIIKHDRGIFLGTENGLYVRQSGAFVNYTEKHNMPNYIWTIFETNMQEIVFAAFDTKIRVLDKNNVLLEFYKQNSVLELAERFYMDGMFSSKGEWVIPTSQGIYFTKDNQHRYIKLLLNGLSASTFCTFEDTINQRLFFGTTQGVFIYDQLSKEIRNLQTEKSNVLDIEKDKYGRLWFCTNKNVFLYENDTLVSFKETEAKVNESTVSCCKDAYGNMWLAHKTGLYLCDYKEEKEIYGGSFTFINNYKDSHIIAGSTFGILYIDLKKLYNGDPNAMRFFDRFNGFIGIECGQNGTCVDSKGNVWIPTSESVVKFMPEKLEYDTIPPLTYIYLLQSSGSDLIWNNIGKFPVKSDSTYQLKWDKSNIKIDFHGIDFKCPERVKYKYRLKGFTDNWTIDSCEYVIYTNLSKGNYTFEVYSCNENSCWSETPATISIHIVPAFWQTLFFKITIALLFISVVAGLTYYYFVRQRKKEKEQEGIERKLVEMQLKTINSQLDPHFLFNAISAIGTEVQKNNNEKAYYYFVKVSRLLKESLQNREKISRSISEELDFVKNYLNLQKFRFGERINFDIVIEEGVNIDTIVPKLCIQIFVENAIKHGLENKPEGGKIEIKVRKIDKAVEFQIIDDGVGRGKAKKYSVGSTGVGLDVFKQYFTIMNKFNVEPAFFIIDDLFDLNSLPTGTKVVLVIPENYNFSRNSS